MFKLDDTLVIDFLAESLDQLESVESDLLALEILGAAADEEQVNRVFRAVHSIKGGAGFFSLVKIGELAHRSEDVLGLIRSRKLVPTPACVQVLLHAVDRLSDMLHSPKESNQADIAEIVAELAVLLNPLPDPMKPGSVAPTAIAPESAGDLRILLVEDDFACRFLLQSFLCRYGECHIAVNGREAVDAFRASLKLGQPYDLICMDIMMPEMDGLEAVHQIRSMEESHGIRSTHGVKIIMTTTVDAVSEVFKCFNELCDAYLVKPIDLGQLLNQMRSCQLIG